MVGKSHRLSEVNGLYIKFDPVQKDFDTRNFKSAVEAFTDSN